MLKSLEKHQAKLAARGVHVELDVLKRELEAKKLNSGKRDRKNHGQGHDLTNNNSNSGSSVGNNHSNDNNNTETRFLSSSIISMSDDDDDSDSCHSHDHDRESDVVIKSSGNISIGGVSSLLPDRKSINVSHSNSNNNKITFSIDSLLKRNQCE